jgi:hypothetical protein
MPNKFNIGDRVRVKSDKGPWNSYTGHNIESGDIGKVVSAPTFGNIEVKLENGGSTRTGSDYWELVEAASTSVLYHCMKITDFDEGTFDKLGDYELPENEVQDYLWEKFGSGVYIVKVKNENQGNIFTLSEVSKPSFESTKGIAEVLL